MRDYLCSRTCGLTVSAKIGAALDRAPRPYTVTELVEITGIPMLTVNAFLRCNKANDKVSARRIPNTGIPGPAPLEYWRGTSGVMETFEVSNMMDGTTEDGLKNGKRPISWRDGNRNNWSIDEADTVAAMRGDSVVRFGKLDVISYSKQGVTIKVKNSIKVTFLRRG